MVGYSPPQGSWPTPGCPGGRAAPPTWPIVPPSPGGGIWPRASAQQAKETPKNSKRSGCRLVIDLSPNADAKAPVHSIGYADAITCVDSPSWSDSARNYGWFAPPPAPVRCVGLVLAARVETKLAGKQKGNAWAACKPGIWSQPNACAAVSRTPPRWGIACVGGIGLSSQDDSRNLLRTDNTAAGYTVVGHSLP
jgi:hypothetical protein